MTKPLTFTQAGIRRAIEGARAAGLDVAAVTVRPDGTIVIHSPALAPNAMAGQTDASEWDTFQA